MDRYSGLLYALPASFHDWPFSLFIFFRFRSFLGGRFRLWCVHLVRLLL